MLGPVSGRVDAAEPDAAGVDLGTVLERRVRIVDLCGRVNVHRQAVIQRQPPVPRDVIRVRVRLEHGRQPDAAALGLGEDRLDRVRRVDNDRDPLVLVPHEIGRAAEVLVHELCEDHAGDASSGTRYLS